ncbi:MAG: DUF3592 domain-containing protein [Flavobacteriaceae bacterium]
MNSDIALIFISLLSVLVIIGLYIMVVFYLKNKKIEQWNKIEGEIISIFFAERDYNYMEDIEDFGPTKSKSYNLKIRYSFSFKNKIYESSNIYPSKIKDFLLSDKEKQKISNSYEKGDKIMVYVNPKNFKQSAIIEKIKFYDLSFVIITLCFIILLIIYYSRTN